MTHSLEQILYFSEKNKCIVILYSVIVLIGVLAMSGTAIPGDIYAWTVVFLLPVNSALNPILYTISSLKFKVRHENCNQIGKCTFLWKPDFMTGTHTDTSNSTILELYFVLHRYIIIL